MEEHIIDSVLRSEPKMLKVPVTSTSEGVKRTRVSLQVAGSFEEERWDPLVLDETVG